MRRPLGALRAKVCHVKLGGCIWLQGNRSFGYVHGFFRMPVLNSIPATDLKGDKVDQQEVFNEIDEYHVLLKQSVIFDHMHLMGSLAQFESCRTSEVLTHVGQMILPMPRFGIEHRTSEFNDTMRYIRASGFAGTPSPLLQQDPNTRADAGDFVLLPTGLLAAKSKRTNATAIKFLNENTFGEGPKSTQAFPIWCTEISDGAPPLGDFFGFGGNATLFIWDNPDGVKVASFVMEKVGTRPWEVCKIEPGCNFLTFHGGFPKYEIFADEDYPKSLEAMANAGFNPIPVKWSACTRIGLSMRAITLVIRFARGGFGGGGMGGHDTRETSTARKVWVPNAKKGMGGNGDSGSPLFGQLVANEIPQTVYQPPPRYFPPKPRPGSITEHVAETSPTLKFRQR